MGYFIGCLSLWTYTIEAVSSLRHSLIFLVGGSARSVNVTSDSTRSASASEQVELHLRSEGVADGLCVLRQTG